MELEIVKLSFSQVYVALKLKSKLYTILYDLKIMGENIFIGKKCYTEWLISLYP